MGEIIGGTTNGIFVNIAVDASGNVYTIGNFYGTMDFDPGAGTSYLTSPGQDDIFISKLNSKSNFLCASYYRHLCLTDVDRKFVKGGANKIMVI